MQSILFAVTVVLLVCGLGQAVPVNISQINNDSGTRLIVPPEMVPNYFEILKMKSEAQDNSTKAEKADFTPMNFLRTSADSVLNKSSFDQKPIVAFEAKKQTPIFITIPIIITSGSEGLPISIDSILTPQTASMATHSLTQRSIKTEDIYQQKSPSTGDVSKQDLTGRHFRIKGKYIDLDKFNVNKKTEQS